MADKKQAAAAAAATADAKHDEHKKAAAAFVQNPTPENLAAALQAADESAPAQTAANLANAEARDDSGAYGN